MVQLIDLKALYNLGNDYLLVSTDNELDSDITHCILICFSQRTMEVCELGKQLKFTPWSPIEENEDVDIFYRNWIWRKIDRETIYSTLNEFSDLHSGDIEKSFNNISELYLKGIIDDETFQKAEELYIEKGFGTGIGGSAQIGEVRKRKDGTKWKKVAATGQMSDWKQIKEDGSEVEQKEGEEKQKKGEEPQKKLSPKEIGEAAKNTSEEALNNTIKQSDDPKLREAAHKELDRRTKEEHVQEEKEGEGAKEESGKLIHQLPNDIVEKVKKDGFKYSTNSMYGEGVYFSNKNAYGDKQGYSSIEVELKPHKQLKVDRDIDVPSKIKEITGLDTYSGEKTRKALIDKGYGSVKFPTENGEEYTVVLDKDLIKIKDEDGKEEKEEKKSESEENQYIEKFRTLSDEQVKFYIDAPYKEVN